jgi:DNA-directed RNA polymerase specialized sigma24 family protein
VAVREREQTEDEAIQEAGARVMKLTVQESEATMDFAEAVNRLTDELAEVWARAEGRGLTDEEIVEEFKRVLKENERQRHGR